MRRGGLTLLETMVALVILGLVVLGFLAVFQSSLAVFQSSTRLAGDSERWSRAVAYAEDAMETVKLDPPLGSAGPARAGLAGGFARSVEARAWDDSLRLVTVVVTLPDGGRVTLNRLVEIR